MICCHVWQVENWILTEYIETFFFPVCWGWTKYLKATRKASHVSAKLIFSVFYSIFQLQKEMRKSWLQGFSATSIWSSRLEQFSWVLEYQSKIILTSHCSETRRTGLQLALGVPLICHMIFKPVFKFLGENTLLSLLDGAVWPWAFCSASVIQECFCQLTAVSRRYLMLRSYAQVYIGLGFAETLV